MPEVHLRELELRVVHRGMPWLDRAALTCSGERIRRAILADLERLLAEALRDCDPDAALGEVDLAIELGASGPKVSRLSGSKLVHASGRAPAAILQPHHHEELAGSAIAAELPSHPPTISPLAAPPLLAVAVASGADALLAILLDWHAEASLERRLALLPEALLSGWRRLLCDLLWEPSAPSHGTDDRALHGPASPAQAFSPEERPKRVQARFRGESEALLALVALVARHAPRPPPAIEIEALLSPAVAPPTTPSRVTPAGADDLRSSALAAAKPAAAEAEPDLAGQPRAAPESAAIAPAPPLVRALPAVASIANALPFLMLGPLDRTGWLAAAGAALAAADLDADASLLGFALAQKALPPPARGWHHDPAQLQIAALAAGLAEPPAGARIAEFERRLGGQLALADAVIADALLCGRSAETPLALVALEGAVALIEPEGLFPLAIGAGWEDIAAVAIAAAAPIVCGPQAAAPDLLRAIDLCGLTFAARGAPGRGEAWRQVAGPAGWRGMTNADPATHPGLARAAAWAEDEERALVMLDAFGKERPIAGAQAGGALDRSLTLAATVALGDIAWRLHGSNPEAWTKPEAGLAFDRFHDLSARVEIEAERIELLLPLGPRARDLLGAGLGADVAGIPWLGRRRLHFAVG